MELKTVNEKCSCCSTCRLACAIENFRKVKPSLAVLRIEGRFPAPGDYRIHVCDQCGACADVCPGHAVTGHDWQVGIPRESLYDFSACRETALDFEKKRKVVHDSICGMCIAACPWTKKYLKRVS